MEASPARSILNARQLVGIAAFDAERLKRSHILRERLRASEASVEALISSIVNKTDAAAFDTQPCLQRMRAQGYEP